VTPHEPYQEALGGRIWPRGGYESRSPSWVDRPRSDDTRTKRSINRFESLVSVADTIRLHNSGRPHGSIPFGGLSEVKKIQNRKEVKSR